MRQSGWETSPTYTFGNNPPYKVRRARVRGLGIIFDSLTLNRPDISRDNYLRALDDINNSFGSIKDADTGKEFEIAVANTHLPFDEGIDLEMSTYTSSLSGNPGNAVEFA